MFDTSKAESMVQGQSLNNTNEHDIDQNKHLLSKKGSSNNEADSQIV